MHRRNAPATDEPRDRGASTSPDRRPRRAALRADVRGRADRPSPKWLPPKWFYDARGSELFEQITRLPEYYPTRAEREILAARAGEIAALTGGAHAGRAGLRLVGEDPAAAGRAAPARHAARVRPAGRVRVSALREAAAAIAADYPGLAVHGVVGDFTEHLDQLPGRRPRLVAFLGGTIGNLVPAERAEFFRPMRAALEPRRLAAARHRPGEGPGACWCRRTTTPPGSPPSSTATCCG